MFDAMGEAKEMEVVGTLERTFSRCNEVRTRRGSIDMRLGRNCEKYVELVNFASLRHLVSEWFGCGLEFL